MKTSALAVLLVLALAGAATAHTGAIFFLPSVPDPASMNIDGSEDDWGWFDRDFAVGPDGIEAWAGQFAGQGPGAQGDDYQASYFMAWSLPPDNALYFFARVADDSLKSSWGDNLRNWWDDDTMMIGVDADHSGGSILVNENIEEAQNGYRIVVNSLATNEFGIDYGGMLGGGDFPEGDWGGQPPWGLAATQLTPPDATHGSSNVEYTYEIKLALWASYDPAGPDGDLNQRYTFAPDQVTHTTPRLNDVDNPEGGGGAGMYGYVGGAFDGQADGDQAADFQTILTHDPAEVESAVENVTWGRIKSRTHSLLD